MVNIPSNVKKQSVALAVIELLKRHYEDPADQVDILKQVLFSHPEFQKEIRGKK